MEARPKPPAGPRSSGRDRRPSPGSTLLPGLFAGLISGTLVITFAITLGALLFTGDLVRFVPVGIGIALASSFVIGALVSLQSSYRPVIATPQDSSSVLLALVATSISNQMKSEGLGSEPLPTIVAAIVVSALATGAFFLALGLLRLGSIVRFIPYPVVGGFLAGTGWLLVQGSISVMVVTPPSLADLPALFQPGVLSGWLPGAGFGVLMTVLLRRYTHFLLLPALLALGIGLFYGILALTGTTVAQASASGLLLGPFQDGGLWPPISLSSISEIHWHVVRANAGSLAAVTVLSGISILLNASGLELATEEEIDLDRELRATGIANLAAGAAGGMVGYMSLSESSLNHKLGARTRVAGLLSAALCAVAMVAGAEVLSYFPKPVLGGLLLFLGLSFLIEAIYEAWFKLPRVEYALVILILLVVVMVDFLYGVGVGIVVSSVLFAVNYSRIDVVKHEISATTLRSKAGRSAADEMILQKTGGQIHILQLQGYIFFGTAYNLLKRVSRRLISTEPALVHYVVLDFKHVNGLDSSAVVSFTRMKKLAESLGVRLCMTELPADVRKQLERAECIESPAPDRRHAATARVFPDLDHGIEWCEDGILLANTATRPPPPVLKEELEAVLGTRETVLKLFEYLDKVEAPADFEIYRQGDVSLDLYLIESGELTAWLELGEGRTKRLRTMGPASVVGESGLYLGAHRSATVRTTRPSKLYRLSKEGLDRMTREAPEVSAGFHRFVARLLAQRMVHATSPAQMLFF